MNLAMAGQTFLNVTIPLLWGSRAVVEDRGGKLSVIDLSGETAKLEVLADRPAPGVEFVPDLDGIRIRERGADLYRYSSASRTLTGLSLRLPEVELSPTGIRIGTNFIGGSTVSGFGVGVAVTETGIAIGSPLPPHLAELVV